MIAESGCLWSKGKQLGQILVHEVLVHENRSVGHLLNPSITKFPLHSYNGK